MMINRLTTCERGKLRLYCAIGTVIFVIGMPMPAHSAQKGPSAWWPDTRTGLMWTDTVGPAFLNWDKANAYCSSLALGGFSGWRMPSLDETKTVMSFETYYPSAGGAKGRGLKNSAIIHAPANALPPDPYDYLVFKGGLHTEVETWTSTRVGDSAWTLTPLARNDYYLQKITARVATFCVRTMETDLLQLAKTAQVPSPVPDVQTLRAYVPINQAHASFNEQQYQAAITQAGSALKLNPESAPAFWAIGVSYGMLGQWDKAIANLQSAVKIDKNYSHGKAALKWAQQGQKAAKKGTSQKSSAPVWE